MTWLKHFGVDLVGAHLDGLRAAKGLFWVFVALVLWEFAQHVVEVRAGFFDSQAAARAVALDPTRMVLGWIKMLSVYVGGFLVIRHLALGSAALAFGATRATMLRYLPYIGYSLILFAVMFYARSLVSGADVMTLRMVIGLTQQVVEPLLILWIVSAATDGPVRNPIESAQRLGWLYLWAFPLVFIGRLPINAAHQLLNRFAIGQPKAIVWPMLALDAIVVGLIITIIPALYLRIARRVDAHSNSRRTAPMLVPAE